MVGKFKSFSSVSSSVFMIKRGESLVVGDASTSVISRCVSMRRAGRRGNVGGVGMSCSLFSVAEDSS